MTIVRFVYKIATVDIKTIMTAISDLRNRIDTLHVTVRKIYTATCHPIETLENSTTNIPTLPLTSIEEFWKWEDYILDEENKLMIVRKYLTSLLLCFGNIHHGSCFLVSYFCVTDFTASRAWQGRFEEFCILHYAQADE